MALDTTEDTFPVELFAYMCFAACMLIFYVHFSSNVVAAITHCIANAYLGDGTLSIGQSPPHFPPGLAHSLRWCVRFNPGCCTWRPCNARRRQIYLRGATRMAVATTAVAAFYCRIIRCTS